MVWGCMGWNGVGKLIEVQCYNFTSTCVEHYFFISTYYLLTSYFDCFRNMQLSLSFHL